ncbi:nitroreductase [Marinicaulis aureus]|uniref:Nitroreductase n=1 Tax=Hyphococcus aureus TaxID=2666033 RepID=A0ABW1KYQ4_9PROT
MSTIAQTLKDRRSYRAFLKTPVDQALLESILKTAMLSASNSNIQPWHVYLLSGARLQKLKDATKARSTVPPQFDEHVYKVYPDPLEEPYESRRFHCGERQYSAMGIEREDQAGRLNYVYNNHQCFGAPAAMFLYIDDKAGPSQWADLGIYLQSVMLMLTEAGLGSCAQISWNVFHTTVRDVLNAPENLTLYCGLSIGYPDMQAPQNAVVADRAPVGEVLTVMTD